jgi:hypothetical protein
MLKKAKEVGKPRSYLIYDGSGVRSTVQGIEEKAQGVRRKAYGKKNHIVRLRPCALCRIFIPITAIFRLSLGRLSPCQLT